MIGYGEIETDYLVVGAGALGMGFVDTLIEHSDADVVMIDRRHRPGGHWLDSYPFVQLHQPSMNYGVNSIPLGQDRIESAGRDAGFYERAGGTEICAYYDEIMRNRFVASGRVRFFPMCDSLGERRFRSRVTGAETAVSVRRSVVDATYMASRVPASDPPPFEVAEGATCVPVGALTSVTKPPAGYVIIGGGKTAMDAVCWLLDQGTPPHDITWIRPRDSVDAEPPRSSSPAKVSSRRSKASFWSWKRSRSATRSRRSSGSSRNVGWCCAPTGRSSRPC